MIRVKYEGYMINKIRFISDEELLSDKICVVFSANYLKYTDKY